MMRYTENAGSSAEADITASRAGVIGALIGDVVGSAYEFRPTKDLFFDLFAPGSDYTDDTLMTIAVGTALCEATARQPLPSDSELSQEFLSEFARLCVQHMQQIGARYPYPTGAYGARFSAWLESSHPEPYNSWGNGSAMRVSACGDQAHTMQQARQLAAASAGVSHNHPEGIKGAEATAAMVWAAHAGWSKTQMRDYFTENFYPEVPRYDEIHESYGFDESCQGTVPAAFAAFCDTDSFEDAVRAAVALGGDADTLGAIAGSIAWPFYARDGISPRMAEFAARAASYLDDHLRDRLQQLI